MQIGSTETTVMQGLEVDSRQELGRKLLATNCCALRALRQSKGTALQFAHLFSDSGLSSYPILIKADFIPRTASFDRLAAVSIDLNAQSCQEPEE